MKYKIHPIAEMFPLIDGDAFDALVADIKANGLIEPVEHQGNVIIDGRNRLRACEAAGVVPEYRELSASVDATRYILSRNLHRRQLTTAQRAAIAAELANMEVGDNRGAHRPGKGGSNDPPLQDNKLSIEQAAELMGVSAPTVKRAKKVMQEDPERHQAIKRGEKMKRNRRQDTSNRLLWKKVAQETYMQYTGKNMGLVWVVDHLKPEIEKSCPWVADIHGNSNISEDQAESVKKAVFAYILERNPDAEKTNHDLSSADAIKVNRIIEHEKRVLELRFEQRIKEHMEEVLKLYAEEYDRYKAFNEAYTGVFSDEEYKLLISVLHPDRCQPDRAKQFAKAFHLVKSKEEVLCKVKQNERPTSMPSTLADLIAGRRH